MTTFKKVVFFYHDDYLKRILILETITFLLETITFLLETITFSRIFILETITFLLETITFKSGNADRVWVRSTLKTIKLIV